MNTSTYKDQWMIEDIPEPSDIMYLDPNIKMVKMLFFDQMRTHSYSILRLYWLVRWLYQPSSISTQPEAEEYQNITIDHHSEKKLNLLIDLWKKEYFHPFITTRDAYDIVAKDNERYIIGLSSTQPGSIRITYWNEGVKHHRIDLHTYTSKKVTEIIDYDIYKLEFVIQKFIQNNSLSKIICEYGL